MAQHDQKVVGYFAYLTRMQVVCTGGDACVVSGSSSAMEAYLAELHPAGASKATVKKTRFGDMVQGLRLGAAYAFDKESYSRFYPLAISAGLPVEKADFDDPSRHTTRFLTLRLAVRDVPASGRTRG